MKRYIRNAISDINDEHWQAKEEIAKDLSTPVEVLRHMATYPDSCVKCEIAKNPNAPLDLLEQLSEDGDEVVRWGVTQNPNTSVDLLAQLAEDVNWEVVEGVTENPNTPDGVLLRIKERLDNWAERLGINYYPSRYERKARSNIMERLH